MLPISWTLHRLGFEPCIVLELASTGFKNLEHTHITSNRSCRRGELERTRQPLARFLFLVDVAPWRRLRRGASTNPTAGFCRNKQPPQAFTRAISSFSCLLFYRYGNLSRVSLILFLQFKFLGSVIGLAPQQDLAQPLQDKYHWGSFRFYNFNLIDDWQSILFSFWFILQFQNLKVEEHTRLPF